MYISQEVVGEAWYDGETSVMIDDGPRHTVNLKLVPQDSSMFFLIGKDYTYL